MILKEFLLASIQRLKEAGIQTSKLDVDLIVGHVLNFSRLELLVNDSMELESSIVSKLNDKIEQRIKGYSVAVVIGKKSFYKYEFKVNEHVLVPRPETELIIEEAISCLDINKEYNFLDMGTGSGCLSITLLREFTKSCCLAVDISPQALMIAKENAMNLNVKERAYFAEADLSKILPRVERFDESFDLVVANPPYICESDPLVDESVRRYEPHLALFADKSGTQSMREWVLHLPKVMKSKSLFLMEIGAEQKEVAIDIVSSLEFFDQVECLKDLAGKDRVIKARKG